MMFVLIHKGEGAGLKKGEPFCFYCGDLVEPVAMNSAVAIP